MSNHPIRLSDAEHQQFLAALAAPSDDGEDLLDEEIQVDPYNRQPSSSKSEKAINRIFDILDNLPRGKDAE